MATPTNNSRWSTKEIELLDTLIRGRLELEKDPTSEVLERKETFEWLSGQFELRGHNRSAAAVKRRCAGRLQFRADLKSNTLPSQMFNEVAAEVTSSFSQHLRTSSSSSDDIPLSQRRRNLGFSFDLAQSQHAPVSASRKRRRTSVESEIHDTIVVERREQAHQVQFERTSIHPPATLVAHQALQTFHPLPPQSSQRLDINAFDNEQGKFWLQKKTKHYQDRITKAKSELQQIFSAKANLSTKQQRLRQAVQENDAETERLTNLLENLKIGKESLKHQQSLLEEASRPDEEHIRGIQAAIKEDENKMMILSAAAGI